MAVLEPTLCILDETDSGLDVDGIESSGEGISALKSKTRSFLVITHYPRILEYIVPDRVHVLAGGKIVKTGNNDLAHELENRLFRIYDRCGLRDIAR